MDRFRTICIPFKVIEKRFYPAKYSRHINFKKPFSNHYKDYASFIRDPGITDEDVENFRMSMNKKEFETTWKYYYYDIVDANKHKEIKIVGQSSSGLHFMMRQIDYKTILFESTITFLLSKTNFEYLFSIFGEPLTLDILMYDDTLMNKHIYLLDNITRKIPPIIYMGTIYDTQPTEYKNFNCWDLI